MAPGPLLRRHRVALVLGALWVVHVVANAVWLTMDQTPMSGFEDQSSHYSSLLFLTAKLGLGHTGEGLAFLLREVSISYPVLSFSCHALAGLLFGPSRLVFCLANAAYLVPLLWGTYEIGRLCRGRGAGLLAAALVSLMPAVYGGARHLGVDFNALCLLPLAMVSLLHCDGFRDLRASALLGLTAGVAVLAKVSVLFFLMGPVTLVFAVSLGRAVRRGPRGTLRRVLAGAAVAATAAAVTTSPWWFGRLQQLVSVTGHFTVDAHTPEMSLSEALELCLSSWPFLHSWPLALCALLALPLFLWRGRHRLEVLCWATVPLLVYPVLFSGSMPVPFMVDRYLFPLAPAAAVILGVGIVSLPRFQVTASCVILGLAVALWISCSFYPRQNQLGSCGTRAPDPRPLFARLATCGRCNYAGLSERPDAHGCNTFDTRRAGDGWNVMVLSASDMSSMNLARYSGSPKAVPVMPSTPADLLPRLVSTRSSATSRKLRSFK